MSKIESARSKQLIFGVVTLLFAGIIYAWSIIKAPFEGVWNPAQLGINYTLTIIFFCLGGLFSGLISKKVSTTIRLLASAVLLLTGFFIASRLEGGSVFKLYISYGVLCGVGIGIAYHVIVSSINAWFPDKRGFCTGILLMGFGLSLVIIGEVINAISRYGAINWRSVYTIFAVSIAALFAIAAFMIKPPPAGTVFPASKKVKKAQKEGEAKSYTALEMIRRPSFILIFIYITLLASSGSAAISFARDIVTDAGAVESLARRAVGLLGISNGVGRLTAGWLFDRLGIRKTQFISASLAIMAPLTVVLGLTTSSLIICLAGMCLCGLSYGFAPTSCGVFASEFYGPKNFPINFSIFNLILIPAPFAAALAGAIKASTGEFMTAFIILTACTAVAFIINLFIRKP